MMIENVVYEYRLSGGERLAWHSRYHAHDTGEYELHYFLEGTGFFLNNRTKYPIKRGALFLTGPNEFHSIVPEADCEGSQPITYYAVLFRATEKDQRIRKNLLRSLSGVRLPEFPDYRYHFFFEEIRHLSNSPERHLRAAAAHLLSGFLYIQYGKSTGRPVNSAGSIQVAKALEIMKNSVRKKLLIGDLAGLVGVSEEHLIRLFKAELRMTPLQYLHRLKVEAASGLLISTGKTIREVSALIGFENQFHFSKIFKGCTGLTPTAYRGLYVQMVDMTQPTPTLPSLSSTAATSRRSQALYP